MTFIVRIAPDEAGRLTGVVERVRTGEKERFHRLEAVGAILARMVTGEATHPDDSTEDRP